MRLQGTATTHSQAGSFHTIVMDLKTRSRPAPNSINHKITVHSNAETPDVLYLLVGLNGFCQPGCKLAAHAVVRDASAQVSCWIGSVLLLAVRL